MDWWKELENWAEEMGRKYKVDPKKSEKKIQEWKEDIKKASVVANFQILKMEHMKNKF